MTDDETIARHIQGFKLLLAQQVEQAGGWPQVFRFPEPATDAEREALRLFIQVLQTATGAEINITYT